MGKFCLSDFFFFSNDLSDVLILQKKKKKKDCNSKKNLVGLSLEISLSKDRILLSVSVDFQS